MENNFYSGLSRTFEAYFPQVKESVKQTIEFFNAETFTLPTPKVDDEQSAFVSDYIPRRNGPKKHASKLVGKFTIEDGDEENILPKLKYEVQSGCGKNPTFYLVTTPLDDVIYIGTTETGKRKKSVSASTLTGGLLPPHDNRDAYCAYLGIMSVVKKFGHALVYEVDTQYSNTFLDQYGCKTKIYPTNIIIDNIINELYDAAERNGSLMISSMPGCDEETSVQAKTSISIWNSVKSFFNMYKNGALNVKGNPSNGEEIKVAVRGDRFSMVFSSNFMHEIMKKKKEKEDNKIKGLISEKVIGLCNPSRDNDKFALTDCKKSLMPFAPIGPEKAMDENSIDERGKEVFEYEEKIHDIIKKKFFVTYLNIGYDTPCKQSGYSSRMSSLPSSMSHSQIILSFEGAEDIPSKVINEIVKETEVFLGICVPDAKIVIDTITSLDEIVAIEQENCLQLRMFNRDKKN